MTMNSPAYDGASTTRRQTKTWRPKLGNSDTDDLPSRQPLATKILDAARNQPLMASAKSTKVTNTIGSGLILQSTINRDFLGINDDDASRWERNTEFEFKLWSESKNCDAERTKDFNGIQNTAYTSEMLMGDVAVLTPLIDRGSIYSLAVQLIEAPRLSNPNDALDTEKIAGGIECDEYGAPIAYYFSKYHPGGLSRYKKAWVRIEAYGKKTGRSNVIHLAGDRTRPGQRRGVSIFAPVLESLKQLDKYTNAELEAALVSGLYAVFIKSETGETTDSPVPEDQKVGIDQDLELTPGMIASLLPGESIETSDPGRPNTAYEAFVMSIIKQIGAAVDIPLELLVKHFSSSYSASRAALLEAWKGFKISRTRFSRNFCQPIYEEFLYEAVLMGRIIAPGFLENEAIRKAYCGAEWNGPTPGQLDPEKETDAAAKRVQEGFSTRTKEAAEMNGTDFEQNTRVAKRENAQIKDAGLKQIDNSKVILAEKGIVSEKTKKEEEDE